MLGRTSAGAKLITLTHNSWCAFEVDGVRGMFDWASVDVNDRFSAQPSERTVWDHAAALAANRRLRPSTLMPNDPSSHRNARFRVHAAGISGRCPVASRPVICTTSPS
jgi:hypothetical protein